MSRRGDKQLAVLAACDKANATVRRRPQDGLRRLREIHVLMFDLEVELLELGYRQQSYRMNLLLKDFAQVAGLTRRQK